HQYNEDLQTRTLLEEVYQQQKEGRRLRLEQRRQETYRQRQEAYRQKQEEYRQKRASKKELEAYGSQQPYKRQLEQEIKENILIRQKNREAYMQQQPQPQLQTQHQAYPPYQPPHEYADPRSVVVPPSQLQLQGPQHSAAQISWSSHYRQPQTQPPTYRTTTQAPDAVGGHAWSTSRPSTIAPLAMEEIANYNSNREHSGPGMFYPGLSDTSPALVRGMTAPFPVMDRSICQEEDTTGDAEVPVVVAQVNGDGARYDRENDGSAGAGAVIDNETVGESEGDRVASVDYHSNDSEEEEVVRNAANILDSLEHHHQHHHNHHHYHQERNRRAEIQRQRGCDMNILVDIHEYAQEVRVNGENGHSAGNGHAAVSQPGSRVSDVANTSAAANITGQTNGKNG
ncbi:hypothetical protein BGZ65_005976, partial [Modicella reniformis]